METKVKMKRHESFSIREGWLVKGLNCVRENDKIFSASNATDILGMGTNMVKSLKYWMFATKLIKEECRKIVFTELASLITRYDPYLESLFSWWFIHISLVTNLEDAYVFNRFFNKCNLRLFTKKDVYDQIVYELNSNNIDFNENTLQDEITMITKIYGIEEKIDNPENNFICPLTELKLISKHSRDTFERTKPLYKNLNYLIVFYLLEQLLLDRDSISIDDLLKTENGLGKILNLDKNLINEYLDELKKNELITVNRTAGLNMIYIRRRMDLAEIFTEYFE